MILVSFPYCWNPSHLTPVNHFIASPCFFIKYEFHVFISLYLCGTCARQASVNKLYHNINLWFALQPNYSQSNAVMGLINTFFPVKSKILWHCKKKNTSKSFPYYLIICIFLKVQYEAYFATRNWFVTVVASSKFVLHRILLINHWFALHHQR